jgi:hypothetical protein
MRQSILGGLVLAACSLPVVAGTPELPENPRTLPMQFSLQAEKPADCGAKCQILIFAAGMITADTPRQFEIFAADNNLREGIVVLDSDGGSVHGALALGRAIRRLGLSTMVGRRAERPNGGEKGEKRELWTRADCESMCAFVLLGGVRREVSANSRVMVHQIWLGDRREDAIAANYSAEDLVLVQRDIGKLVRYTAEMGGGADLIDLALRIPPWEPMHALTREELRRANLDMSAQPAEAASSAVAAPVAVSVTTERAAPVNDRGWAMIDRSGRGMLGRRHPLTYEGERIGSFDLILACGDTPGTYAFTYVETRTGVAGEGVPRALKKVRLWLEQSDLTLKIASSENRNPPRQLETVASVNVPAAAVRAFADTANRSLTVETISTGFPPTTIRIGNTGFARSLPQLEASCGQNRLRRDAHARLD